MATKELAQPAQPKNMLLSSWTKEIRILTSYYCGPPDFREAMRLLAAGEIDVERMITHRLPLEDIGRGFELVMSGEEAVKVIIKPHAKRENTGS